MTDARGDFSDVLNRVAYAHERVIVTRHGKPLAAIIPAEDLELLEALEEARDVADFDQALAEDDGEHIRLEDLRAELDI